MGPLGCRQKRDEGTGEDGKCQPILENLEKQVWGFQERITAEDISILRLFFYLHCGLLNHLSSNFIHLQLAVF